MSNYVLSFTFYINLVTLYSKRNGVFSYIHVLLPLDFTPSFGGRPDFSLDQVTESSMEEGDYVAK